ncbi:hypothetical protein [Hydrogenophaga sp. 5NK40-0174]|uniref:hypothetical protein n=1 Tax=Hydrogenophaga sp. 5NK40-0174 TaxID=3127649 RepID=UPI00310C35AE
MNDAITLNIAFPDNLICEGMVRQVDIPSLAKVSGSKTFTLEFPLLFPGIIGQVTGWTPELVADRAPAGAGGEFTHVKDSLVSLRKVDSTSYRIIALKFFYASHGWLNLVEGGTWSSVFDPTPPEYLGLDIDGPSGNGRE